MWGLKAVTILFWKIYLNDLFMTFQCLQRTLLIFGRDWLYVNTSRSFVSFKEVLALSCKSYFLSIFLTVFYVIIYLICNFDWQISVWAPHNIDWSHLVWYRSVWFLVLDYMAYCFLAIYDILNLNEESFGGQHFWW